MLPTSWHMIGGWTWKFSSRQSIHILISRQQPNSLFCNTKIIDFRFQPNAVVFLWKQLSSERWLISLGICACDQNCNFKSWQNFKKSDYKHFEVCPDITSSPCNENSEGWFQKQRLYARGLGGGAFHLFIHFSHNIWPPGSENISMWKC